MIAKVTYLLSVSLLQNFMIKGSDAGPEYKSDYISPNPIRPCFIEMTIFRLEQCCTSIISPHFTIALESSKCFPFGLPPFRDKLVNPEVLIKQAPKAGGCASDQMLYKLKFY